MPDPRVTNPELFDLRNPNAPIPQFVNAMKMGEINLTPEQVANRITYEELKDKGGNPYVFAAYNLNPDPKKQGDSIPLMIAPKNKNGEFVWVRTSPKIGKLLGLDISTSVFDEEGLMNPNYQQRIIDNFTSIEFTQMRILLDNSRSDATKQLAAIKAIAENQNDPLGVMYGNFFWNEQHLKK